MERELRCIRVLGRMFNMEKLKILTSNLGDRRVSSH